MRRAFVAGYLFLSLVWGSTWMAIRVLVNEVPPLYSAALRFLLSTALLVVIVAVRRTPLPRDARAWRAFAVLGITMIGFPYASVFWAERRITSGATAVIYAMLPLAVALFTPLTLHQRVPRRAVYAMTVALGGIAVLFYGAFSLQPRMLTAGILLILGIVMQAWSYVYAKVRLKGVSPFVSTAAQFFVGSVVLFASSFAMEREQPHWTRNSLLSLAYLVIFGSVLTFTVYYWLLERMPPYQLSSFNFVVPIIAVVLGALVLQEPVPPTMIVAMVIVLASVAAVLRSDNAPEITTLRGEHIEEHG